MLVVLSSATVVIEHAWMQPDRGGISRIVSPDCSAFQATADPRTFQRYAGYFNYAALSQLHLFVCVSVSVFVVLLLWALDMGKRTKVAVILVSFVAAAISTIVPVVNPWLLTRGLLEREIAQTCPGVAALFVRQEQASIFSATMLVAAAAALIFFAGGSARRLAGKMRQGSWVLYAATALLVTSVLRIHAVYHWIALAEPAPQAAAAVAMLGDALTRAWGAYYTLFLATIYIPSYVIARMRAEPLIPPEVTGESSEKWLRDHGLSLTIPELLPRALAVLAPLLAGQSANLLGSVF